MAKDEKYKDDRLVIKISTGEKKKLIEFIEQHHLIHRVQQSRTQLATTSWPGRGQAAGAGRISTRPGTWRRCRCRTVLETAAPGRHASGVCL